MGCNRSAFHYWYDRGSLLQCRTNIGDSAPYRRFPDVPTLPKRIYRFVLSLRVRIYAIIHADAIPSQLGIFPSDEKSGKGVLQYSYLGYNRMDRCRTFDILSFQMGC